MITVIIAGGSGTRLWPLSTQSNPKQLLKLTSERSLVQMTYDRAKQLSKEIYVIPDVSHAEALRVQLPELDDNHIVVEPGRRGTMNCIIAALVHIAKHQDHDEPIAFIHADHHIRDVVGFESSFRAAAQASRDHGKVTLVGVEPTYPATTLGYIERNGELEGASGVFQVASFKEKPDLEIATQYLAKGNYLWNCGYFVGSVNTFLAEMKRTAPELCDTYNKLKDSGSSEEYKAIYLSFDEKIIDYALSEKSNTLLVVPATFDWMDIGNFADLHEANQKDGKANYLHGDNIYDMELENAYIRNEEDKPLVVIGLDNVVVVNTKDGILVARKDVSHKVGEIAKKLQN